MCVMAFGWITPQPFAPLFNENHLWCDSHEFPVALCCIVAGKDAVPCATLPKYYHKKILTIGVAFGGFGAFTQSPGPPLLLAGGVHYTSTEVVCLYSYLT